MAEMAAGSPGSPGGLPGPSSTPVPPTSASAGATRPPPRQPLLQMLEGLLRELPGLVSDRVELLSLELRRAGLALAQIVALVVLIAIVGVTAWFAVWVGMAGILIALGLHYLAALFGVLAINLLAAWWAVARIKRLARLLTLPATQRHLMMSPAPPGLDAMPPAAAQPPAAASAA